MQIVSLGDNLHDVSDYFSRKNKKNITAMSAVESADSMVTVVTKQMQKINK